MIGNRKTSLFASKHAVNESGCWIWFGSIMKVGYGSFGIGSSKDGTRRSEYAHRVSWMIHHGPIPDGMCILHRCDVRACVNPAHLFLGTKADNMIDKINKGRQKPGRGRKGMGKHQKAKALADEQACRNLREAQTVKQHDLFAAVAT